MDPFREFMHDQAHETDINFFIAISALELETDEDGNILPELLDENGNLLREHIPDRVLIPAFMTSEIKQAFWIGFIIFIPFIVIDMIVASTLMAMGMMMLPPAMISLPFKVLMFVLVDGWQLMIGSLMGTFRMGAF